MTKRSVYPIIIMEEEDGFYVSIPDFDTGTQGESIADVIMMARDANGLMGIDMQDCKEELPVASAISDIKIENENDIVTLVDVDFDEYRRKNDMRSVRRNVTLPSWLNYQAEKAGVNVSAILQAALKRELQLEG